MFNKSHAEYLWAVSAFSVLVIIFGNGTYKAAPSPNDPHYLFVQGKGDGRGVCKHMTGVFNTHFRSMWYQPDWYLRESAIFSGDSKYAFPVLPGVTHDPAWTRKMMYSKVPSSPEFEAIEWRQGQAKQTEVPGGAVPSPYLIAHVDIDNDGAIDTLVKVQFTEGYGVLANQGTAAGSEMILAWRGQALEFPPGTTLDEIIEGGKRWAHPMALSAEYLRPFIFEGRSYIARYDQGWDTESTSKDAAKPPHETMSILEVRFEAGKDAARFAQWPTTSLCVFNMDQTD